MTSVKLNSIYYSTIQIHIQVVTLVLHNRSETTPHICRMQSCTPRYEKLGSLSQSTFLVLSVVSWILSIFDISKD